MNPNNCATCDYHQPDVPGAHCYMWRDEPTDVCRQHTGREMTIGTIAHNYHGKSFLSSPVIRLLLRSMR